ncbi:MAG TPA: bifunctional 4-hydroxy-2-oxoglutarate aldolase/2-dehydro-3-deoxy-phosphogluconate aldolase [Candidatus Omnitrophica bacterium]|nr:bifunctional 4-hydroxy-2-oxoglutarate aldolase/2-dehydro-3-deoxy-phosphogluconate aldolase [Candidatus Omnitrophota bacterium]
MKGTDLQVILEGGIVPVIRARSSREALMVTGAVRAGGIRVIEITMTVPGAIRVMEELSAKYGDEILLGAGTVLDTETTRVAILSGARFIVSPTLNPKVIQTAKRYGVVVCPGALTPTEVLFAWEAGADLVKVFPCDNVGGPKYITALKAPFPQIRVMPTGGVSLDTAADFIKAGADCLAVGSALIDKKAIKEKKFELITEKARQFLKIVAEARSEN